MGVITNPPVTFSVNEKEEVLIKVNKLEWDSYEDLGLIPSNHKQYYMHTYIH